VDGAEVRVAGVDIGTNTARLLVSDVIGNAIIDVARRSEVVGLGRGLDETGRISEEALRVLDETLTEFADVVAVTGPDLIRVVATSASRDAENSDAVSDIVHGAFGAPPHIITGHDEAGLSFAGARWGSDESGPYLVIDPGGGSTEFVFGLDAPEYAVSIDIGSIRLTDRMLPDRPASDEVVAAARAHVAELFQAVDLPGEPVSVIGVAGTFRTLASVHLGLGYYDRNITHGVAIDQASLDGLVERLAALTVEDTEAIPEMPPRRAPVILGGAIVAAEALRHSGCDSVTVSKTGILQGIVLGLAADS
jgi:exopolyphosphatase/guanosine-5'-triphosphate,3'-diphosphate pyrophosphatase